MSMKGVSPKKLQPFMSLSDYNVVRQELSNRRVAVALCHQDSQRRQLHTRKSSGYAESESLSPAEAHNIAQELLALNYEEVN